MNRTQLFLAGFNGFGQFGLKAGKKVVKFKELEDVLESGTAIDSTAKILIAPSWRYCALALDNHLWLRGLLFETTGEELSVQAPDVVIQIAASDRYCLILLQRGQLYKLNAEVDATLQEIKLESPSDIITPQKRTIFGNSKTKNADLNNVITHIACGEHISVAISNLNYVYGIPSIIHQFSRQFRIKQLVCGLEHALLLSSNGDVYVWGNGLRGQLGHAELHTEEVPTILSALAGIKIMCIAAGGWHSAAISSFGDLYTWGFNKNGQLGLRVYDYVSTPGQKLNAPMVYPLPQVLDLQECCSSECVPMRVYAGVRHTVLHMSCNKVWVTGWNGYGQLGIGDKEVYCDSFQCIDQEDVTKIICGPWCTVFFKIV